MIGVLVVGWMMSPRPAVAVEMFESPRRIVVGEMWKAKLGYVNRSGAAIRVVTANGTEHAQSRPPFLTVYFQSRGGKEWVRLKSPAICGNSNPIEAGEFSLLEKGKRIEGQVYFPWTADVVGAAAMKPGRYLMKVVYTTTAPIDQWVGGPIPEPAHSQWREEIRPLFDKVPHGVFESKPVEFEVLGSGAAVGR